MAQHLLEQKGKKGSEGLFLRGQLVAAITDEI